MRLQEIRRNRNKMGWEERVDPKGEPPMFSKTILILSIIKTRPSFKQGGLFLPRRIAVSIDSFFK